MAAKRTFECLRCDHRFQADYDAKDVVERACPKCGSNSVRPETTAGGAAASKDATGG